MAIKFYCDTALKESLVSSAVNLMKEESPRFAACLELSGEALNMTRFLVDYELAVKRVVREAAEECSDMDDFRNRLFKSIAHNTSYLVLTSLVEAPVRVLSVAEVEACLPGRTSDNGYTVIGYIEHVSPEIGADKTKVIAEEIMGLIAISIGEFLADMKESPVQTLVTNRMVSAVVRSAIDKTLYKYAITPIFDTVVDTPALLSIQVGNGSN